MCLCCSHAAKYSPFKTPCFGSNGMEYTGSAIILGQDTKRFDWTSYFLSWLTFTSCDLFSYKVWSCYVKRFRKRCINKKIQYLTFDLGVKVTQNVAKYPLHQVTSSATKFEVATSNRLGGDTITRKYNIWPLTLTLGSRSHEMLPSTLYTMWPIHLQSLKLLRRDTFTRNLTDGRTDRRTTDRLWHEINIPFFSKEKSGYNYWNKGSSLI